MAHPETFLPNRNGDRVEQLLWFLLGLLPYCSIARMPPNPSFWGQWTAVLLFLLWWALQAARPANDGTARVPWTALLLGSLAAWLLLQPLFGLTSLSLAWTGVAGLVIAALALCSTASIDDPARRERLVHAFAAGTLVALVLNAAAVAIGRAGYELLMFTFYPASVQPRAAGLIGQANQLGTLAVLALAGAMLLYRATRLPGWALWGTVLLSAVVLAASGSRIALLCWVAMMVVAAWGARRPAIGGERALSLGRLGVFAALFAAIQLAWGMLAAGSVVDTTSSALSRPQDGFRQSMMSDALSLWLRHPLAGVGTGRYAEGRLHELDGTLLEAHANNAHNALLQALAEWGAIGGLMLAAAGVLLLAAAWRSLRASDAPAVPVFAVTWVLCLMVYSMAEYPLWLANFLIPFALMAGWLRQPALAGPRTGPRSGARAAVVATVAVAACGLIAGDYLRHQRLAMRLMADMVNSRDGKVHVPLADAAAIAKLTAFPGYASLMLARTLPLNTDVISLKLDIATQAMHTVANHETIARYVAFAVVAGQRDRAEAMMEALRRRHPLLHFKTMRVVAEFGRANADVRAFAEAQAPTAGFAPSTP
jgi:O-antigen ligase